MLSLRRKGSDGPGLAMRIGEEFQDMDDIRYLLRHIGLRTFAEAREVIQKYYPLEGFPNKTLYALEELLGSGSNSQMG